MKTGYKVGDVMTIKPVKVNESISLMDCAVMMKKNHVGSLLVEKNDEVIGIITEQDLVRKGIAESFDTKKTPVSKIMERELLKINPNKDIYDALKMMRDHNIKHLPVFDNNDLVGFLTIKDILKIEPQLFELIVEKFELREEERKMALTEDREGGLCEMCNNYTENLEETDDGSMVCHQCKETV